MAAVGLVDSWVDGGSLETGSCGSEATGCGLLKGSLVSDCKPVEGRVAALRVNKLEGSCILDCDTGVVLTEGCCVCDCDTGTMLTEGCCACDCETKAVLTGGCGACDCETRAVLTGGWCACDCVTRVAASLTEGG